jgi:predicted lipid-binding transport protein (Tim44 family)
MGSGFQFIDIIFFALVAVFVILRLRSVLGRRTGHEQRDAAKPLPRPAERIPHRTPGAGEGSAEEGNDNDNIIRLPGKDGREIAADTPLGAGLTQIKLADPRFDAADFQEKAKTAFEYIVMAFAAGDAQKLKPLLSKDAFEGFAAAIKAREEKGHTLATTLVRIKDAELVEAGMNGRNASVTVRYVTEQINVTRDREGNVVDGDPDRITEAVDIWSYERNTRASDPNWTLVATETPE